MKRVLIIIGVLIILGSIVYWTGYGPQKEIKAKQRTKFKRVIPVETILLKRGSLDRRLKLTGSVESEAMVDVFSKVSGIIETIHVEQGDRVKVKKVIAKVERAEMEARVQEVQAALEVFRARWAQVEAGARPEELTQAEELVRQAKARWENSLENFRRLKNLKDRGVISQQRIDETRLQMTLSEAAYNSVNDKLTLLQKGAREEDRQALLAQIRQAEASLRLAQTLLNNATIRAPIRGIIGKRFVDRGAFVGPSTPIVRIVAMDKVKVIVQVVERELAQLKPGAVAEINVDAYPEEIFQGSIVRISPTLDPESRMADVEIGLNNRDHRLKPGMFARVSLVVQKRKGIILLPIDSLLTGEGPPGVFVNDHGNAFLREIRIGLQGEHYIEVLSGLEEGDEVIMVGHYDLKDGMSVKVLRRHEKP